MLLPAVAAVHLVHHPAGAHRPVLQLHQLRGLRGLAVHRPDELPRRCSATRASCSAYGFTLGFSIVTDDRRQRHRDGPRHRAQLQDQVQDVAARRSSSSRWSSRASSSPTSSTSCSRPRYPAIATRSGHRTACETSILANPVRLAGDRHRDRVAGRARARSSSTSPACSPFPRGLRGCRHRRRRRVATVPQRHASRSSSATWSSTRSSG